MNVKCSCGEQWILSDIGWDPSVAKLRSHIIQGHTVSRSNVVDKTKHIFIDGEWRELSGGIPL